VQLCSSLSLLSRLFQCWKWWPRRCCCCECCKIVLRSELMSVTVASHLGGEVGASEGVAAPGGSFSLSKPWRVRLVDLPFSAVEWMTNEETMCRVGWWSSLPGPGINDVVWH